MTLPGPALARAALLLLAGIAATAQANPALQQGRALFTGAEPLAARSGGPGGTALAPAASRCINCHSAPGLRPAAASFGPALGAAGLLQPRPRRGGPPSRYDAVALCRLLRSGQDPAGVLLPAAMPRYTLGDDQCRALWTLLTSDL